jgi:hypothetical protein
VDEQCREQGVHAVGTADARRGLEGVEAGIVAGGRGRPHVLDGHPVDLLHLADEETAHRADAAGHGAEGAGPVGQPDPHDERLHGTHPTGPT